MHLSADTRVSFVSTLVKFGGFPFEWASPLAPFLSLSVFSGLLFSEEGRVL